jgi:hypothetical protein
MGRKTMARIACLRASVQQLSKERSSSRRDGRRGEQRRDGVVMVYEEMKKTKPTIGRASFAKGEASSYRVR